MNLDFWPAIVFAFVMLCWLAFAAAFIFRSKPPATTESKRESASIFGIVLQMVGYALVWSWRRPIFTPIVVMNRNIEIALAVLTMLIAAASVLLIMSAVRVLGKQWSLTARVVEEHKLITAGPYKFVRHPIYTGMLGMLLATGLALSQWPALTIALIVFAVGTMIRVRSEEKLLRETFGAEYDAYAGRVNAVLPYIF
ncbi:MAG: isoprenylcysteine carboxylmethyltransferase family protein [Pyrinomonadaceae bacterium]